MLTRQRLRTVLNHDPETGVFTWTRGRRKGKIAGTVHNARGGLKVATSGRRYPLHHLGWLWVTGRLPRWTIEHVDGDQGNNCRANLREGDRARRATHRAPRPEPAGFPGVWRVGDMFEAMVETDSVTLHLGTFATAGEARAAVLEARSTARDRQRRRLRATA